MAGKKGRKSQTKTQTVTQHDRAGLVFPVGRLGGYLRNRNYCERVGATAAVAMAGILEYLTQEILELAGNKCEDDKRQRITPKHIQQAVRGDNEFNQILLNTTLSNGGVAPNIHGFFMKKKKGEATQEM